MSRIDGHVAYVRSLVQRLRAYKIGQLARHAGLGHASAAASPVVADPSLRQEGRQIAF